ncbi:MAG: acetamidase/formamidase family protein [Oscillospiraceae bacterium]|nr:acetamidase/formamidase family protein [Oscillospiraceae bacterium]
MTIRNMCVFALGETVKDIPVVKQGEVIVFETNDCFNNQITDENYVLDALDWEHINPATGPVYIEGAEKGDVLKVEILDIELAEEGTMCCLPENGVLGGDITQSQVKKIPVKDGKAIFNQFRLPLNPMIGVIGVAPEGEPVACGTPGRHGGNMDNTKIAKGATLYLPVFRDGAYFGCGDVHACMGDGEIMVSGVEIPARISLRFTVVNGVSIDNPRLEDKDFIYTIASDADLEKAVYTATKDMCDILCKNLGYTLNEAGMLMSARANLQFCQVVDPERTVRMAVPKSICDKVL